MVLRCIRIGVGIGMTAGLLLSCNGLVGFSELEKVSATTDGGGGTGVAPKLVAVGRKTSCVIMGDDTLRCWGANPGVAPGTLSRKPVKVTSLTKVASVSIGLEHACALSEGVVSCWGLNEAGQLGDGTTQPRPEPKVIGQLPAIETIVTGGSHSCAYTSVDVEPVQAFCWGENDSGQLGDEKQQNSTQPVKLELGADVKLVRLGPGTGFTCAIVEKSKVLETWCWGRNDKGQCGQDPIAMPIVLKPTKVDVPQMERVYPGADHMCTRTVGDKLPWCWGANDHGQLGLNKTSPFEKPTGVVGLGQLDTMLPGARHTCLFKVSLEAVCWGANDKGQFGDQPGTDRLLFGAAGYLAPKSNVSMRQAEHGCRLLDGVVSCWGANETGQLGNGKMEPFSAPSNVDLPP